MTTNTYMKNAKQNHWKPFNKQLWQRSFYDHIIRNEIELEKIRHYIHYNASKWDIDRNNPGNIDF